MLAGISTISPHLLQREIPALAPNYLFNDKGLLSFLLAQEEHNFSPYSPYANCHWPWVTNLQGIFIRRQKQNDFTWNSIWIWSHVNRCRLKEGKQTLMTRHHQLTCKINSSDLPLSMRVCHYSIGPVFAPLFLTQHHMLKTYSRQSTLSLKLQYNQKENGKQKYRNST